MDKNENPATPNIVKEPAQETGRKVRDDKGRKKDDKSVEQVLKALNTLQTSDEKLAAMCKKYAEIVEENRKLQVNSKQYEKKTNLAQREKEQLQLEYNKAILTRSKLESLCRELQRQNKAIKDESLLKIREEEERRKETQAKFQTTLTEITTLMQQNNEKNNKLRDNNVEMSQKFNHIVEQYELREQQVEKMSKQMDLENQLSEAKLAKAKTEALAEKEIHMKEKQQLLLELTKYQSKLNEQEALEVALRQQISVYTDKYDEFQSSLTKSNQVFGGFKNEMEKMSKKILKLEKETVSWKQRWEKSQAALITMAADKQSQDSNSALTSRQLQQLQRLCRTLQAERTALLSTLKAQGITPPTIEHEPEPIPEIQPAVSSKYDKMALNCLELKQNLAELQGQLDTLTSSAASNEKVVKTTKQKKQKNKKTENGDKTEVNALPEVIQVTTEEVIATSEENGLTIVEETKDTKIDTIETVTNQLRKEDTVTLANEEIRVLEDKLEERLNVIETKIKDQEINLIEDKEILEEQVKTTEPECKLNEKGIEELSSLSEKNESCLEEELVPQALDKSLIVDVEGTLEAEIIVSVGTDKCTANQQDRKSDVIEVQTKFSPEEIIENAVN